MISIQSYRLSIGLFQFNFKNFKVKKLTYGDGKRDKMGKQKYNFVKLEGVWRTCGKRHGRNGMDQHTIKNHVIRGGDKLYWIRKLNRKVQLKWQLCMQDQNLEL